MREEEAGQYADYADEEDDDDVVSEATDTTSQKLFSKKQLESQKNLKRYNAFMKEYWKTKITADQKKVYSAKAKEFKYLIILN